ncbi:hypothetical protein [Ruminiclostridium josui]|nr:hypothetical protein [Ruminiclostridium josui]
MIRTGLKYILNSVKEIDLDLLQRIDEEISDGTLWKSQGDLKGEKG